MQKEAASEARLCTSPAVETAQSGTRFGRGGLTRINRNQSQPIAIYRNQWLGCGGLGRAGLAGRTSCDEMNSQMPSEATMTNLSPSLPAAGHGLIMNSLTSGSGMTPCALASPSPSERDMARPTRPLTQTREGGRPRGPAAETTPPAASMRLRSRGKSGLWSLLKSSASILPFFTCEARRGKWVGKHGQKTARSRQAQVQAQAQAQVQVTQVAGVSCGRATYLPHHGARVAGARGPQLVSLEVEYVGRGARAARDRANRRVAKQNLIHLDNLRMCQPGGAMRERGRERERERECVCERERESVARRETTGRCSQATEAATRARSSRHLRPLGLPLGLPPRLQWTCSAVAAGGSGVAAGAAVTVLATVAAAAALAVLAALGALAAAVAPGSHERDDERHHSRDRPAAAWWRWRRTTCDSACGALDASIPRTASSRTGIWFMHHSETFSPCMPCPSKMQSSAWLCEPLKGQQTTPRSWLIFAFDVTPEAPRAGAMPCFVSTPILAVSKVVALFLPSSSGA